ncbi:uncharacterized protein LOC121371006 isoform X2 [Gigantopelta aegis]|uniref:uncharacterized protein LOC121371006 isoform X2 n=1 Tax=Gigantopelta aegis TaxID=1735272 RepID=UPI001B888DD6|nr:uncharacterized protein LOC121371006 isoform X2 [Gigantopelta aegis]
MNAIVNRLDYKMAEDVNTEKSFRNTHKKCVFNSGNGCIVTQKDSFHNRNLTKVNMLVDSEGDRCIKYNKEPKIVEWCRRKTFPINKGQIKIIDGKIDHKRSKMIGNTEQTVHCDVNRQNVDSSLQKLKQCTNILPSVNLGTQSKTFNDKCDFIETISETYIALVEHSKMSNAEWGMVFMLFEAENKTSTDIYDKLQTCVVLKALLERIIEECVMKQTIAKCLLVRETQFELVKEECRMIEKKPKECLSYGFLLCNDIVECTKCHDSTIQNAVNKFNDLFSSDTVYIKQLGYIFCLQYFAKNQSEMMNTIWMTKTLDTTCVNILTDENEHCLNLLLSKTIYGKQTSEYEYASDKQLQPDQPDQQVGDTTGNMQRLYNYYLCTKLSAGMHCTAMKIPRTDVFDKTCIFTKPNVEQWAKFMESTFSLNGEIIPITVVKAYPCFSPQLCFVNGEQLGPANISVQEDMRYECNRLGSFLNFPSSASAIRLSQAGFYYSGRGEETICFSCGLHYEQWTRSDQPLAVHRRLKPFCPFITGINSDNKPIHTDDLMPIQVLGDRERSQIPNETMQVQVLTGDSFVDMESDCESSTGGTKQTASNSSNDVMGPIGANIQSPKYQSDNTSLSNSVSSDLMAPGTVVPKRLSYEHAVYPQYFDIKVREDSFTNWTSSLRQTPAILSKHGFYYAGYADCVRCFYCGIGLKSWEPQDDPLEEHIRNRPSCEFIVFTKGSDFVSEVLQKISQKDQAANSASAPSTRNSSGNSGDLFNSDTVLKAKEMGYNDNIITMAVKALAVNQDQNSPDLETLLEKIFVIEEQQNQATSSHNKDERLTIDAPSGAETSDSNASTASPNGQISEDSTKTNTLDGSLCDTITEYVGETNEEHSDAVMSMGAGHSRLQAAKSDANNSIESSYYSLPARLQSGSSDTSAMTPSMNDKNSDEEERDRIMEENRQLRDEMMCKICLENPINIVFLPCGHYCTCAMCAPALASCPICRSVIRGSVRASTASRKRSGRHS